MSDKKIILYELNEVPDVVFERYCKKSASFKKLLNKFSRYKTKSFDKIPLSPWITWSTVHRGVTYEKHKIQNLGQDVSKQNKLYPPLWTELKNNGYKVGVYGSMHSNKMPSNISDYKFYIPDPFSDHSKCYPFKLEPIQDFQLKLARSSSRNVQRSFFKQVSLKLVLAFFKSGVRISTYIDLIKQLIHEKVDKNKVNRRRVYQSIINFDIFYSLLKSTSPDFCSFFTNHVASAMHRYWEAAYPKDFDGQNKQNKEWIYSYKDEVDFAMAKVENQLNRLVKYANSRSNYEIWVCTSMGQAPVINYLPVKTQLYITNPKRFLQFLGFDDNLFEIMPAMMPRCTFKSKKELIKELSETLQGFLLDNKKCELMEIENSLTIKIDYINKIPRITFNQKDACLEEAGLAIVKIDDNSGSSAYHIPEGVLLIYGSDSNRFNDMGTIATDKIKELITKSI